MNTAQELLEGIESLPPLPATTQRLMAVVGKQDATLDSVVEVIQYDAALTAQVLKLCNSASSGLRRKIGSLREAIAMLGMRRVTDLAVAAHAGGMLAERQAGYDLEAGVLWKHSVAVAIGSAAVAERMGLSDAALVFTAGLLHDIGKVVMGRHVDAAFADIMRLVTEESLSFIEAEKRVLGYSHEEIGALIAERWELPEPIVRCIRYHHDPFSLPTPDPLVDAVYLADTVCLLLGIGTGADGLLYHADQTVLDRHGLEEEDLEMIGIAAFSGLQEAEALVYAATPN